MLGCGVCHLHCLTTFQISSIIHVCIHVLHVHLYDYMLYIHVMHVDPCSTIDCYEGYECLIYEETGEGYCSPNCEELNPCGPDEQCITTTVYCVRAPCPPVLSCEGK